jgi:hypothetical protein
MFYNASILIKLIISCYLGWKGSSVMGGVVSRLPVTSMKEFHGPAKVSGMAKEEKESHEMEKLGPCDA